MTTIVEFCAFCGIVLGSDYDEEPRCLNCDNGVPPEHRIPARMTDADAERLAKALGTELEEDENGANGVSRG